MELVQPLLGLSPNANGGSRMLRALLQGCIALAAATWVCAASAGVSAPPANYPCTSAGTAQDCAATPGPDDSGRAPAPASLSLKDYVLGEPLENANFVSF